MLTVALDVFHTNSVVNVVNYFFTYTKDSSTIQSDCSK